MRIEVDASELDDLIRGFATLPNSLLPAVEKVTSRGALNVKRGWARRWQGHPSIVHLPRAINYDLTTESDAVEAEIGADPRRRQGTLAHLIEFASTEYGDLANEAIPGGQPALDDEEPRYVRAIARAAHKAVVQMVENRGR